LTAYTELPGFENLLLEESFVLSIIASNRFFELAVEFVLTPRHEMYQPPKQDEVECYRKGAVRFRDVESISWMRQMRVPSVDANGEIDYGNIDVFEFDSGRYLLEGDFGRIEIEAGEVTAEFA
jgi:hypothetical protein